MQVIYSKRDESLNPIYALDFVAKGLSVIKSMVYVTSHSHRYGEEQA